MVISDPKIKILGVIDEEPFDYRTWSGTSRYFFSSLKNSGLLYKAIHTQPKKLVTHYYKALSFQPNFERWKQKYHLNTGYFDQMTKIALKKINQFDASSYNVVLQIGAWYNLTKKTDKITVSYHDGNLYAMINNPRNKNQINLKFVSKCMDYEKRLYQSMDLILPMSKWLGETFYNGFGIERNKIIPVGAGINLPYINEITDKNYDEPNILFVGKMFKRKGGEYLLEAFKDVKKEIPNARLTIIGPNLKNLPDGATCLGFISKKNDDGIKTLLNEYSKATVFVMPSLYEPFGIVFAEAMAHQLPCIGTDTCAMPEIIDNGQTGFIVPVGNSKMLGRKIIELLKSPKLLKEMGYNGYIKYKKNFTWDEVATKIQDAIKAH